MHLSKKKMLLLSFMLFSLFFGAGNLIFPPFLGQSAGQSTPIAIAAFLITAVLLPVLGVVVVAKFDGLDKLGSRVSNSFAIVFTILIYLSIGPGLGIPRAASVPFEMAVTPYLPEESPLSFYMFLYSAAFFAVAIWLALTPSKLMERIGKFLSPSLLILLVFLFFSFLFKGDVSVAPAVGSYADNPAVTGFLEGYQTMDTIAALNFGLVIALTLRSLGVTEKHDILHHTKWAGVFAGTILSLVYLILSYVGMASSGVYDLHENGAWTLRAVVQQLFGNGGAILLAAIFTLACLTTCVGLITSISQFFARLYAKIPYRVYVIAISVLSLAICNLGLTAILSISVPILDAIYPVAIMLICLGLADRFFDGNRIVYPLTISCVAVTSIFYSLEKVLAGIGVSTGTIGKLFQTLPLYSVGMGWLAVAIIAIILSVVIFKLASKNRDEANAA